MARIIFRRRFLVAVLATLFLLGGTGFFLHSLFAERYAQTASVAIGAGKSQLFQKSISGALAAYQTFQAASANDYTTASDAEKIKIRVYLAMTRMLDTLLRKDGGSVDTLAELLAQYGVELHGDSLDTLEFTQPPLNDDGKLILPATAPASADALKSFFAGPFLTSLNTSIHDMDEAIALCPTDGTEGVDREIIAGELIAPDDSSQPDVEMDAGDYYLLRSFLKFLKFYALMSAGYNSGLDIREVVAMVNMGPGMEMFKRILDRYPDFLKISDAAKLNEARLTLLGAITDYETASAKIRGDVGTSLTDMEELLSIDLPELAKETFYRDQMARFKYSLENNQAVAFGGTSEWWTFTIPGDASSLYLNTSFKDGFSEGSYNNYGVYDPRFDSNAKLEYAIINGLNAILRFNFYFNCSGWVEFNGTFSADKAHIDGTYTGWSSTAGGFSGSFTANRNWHEANTQNINFLPLFGNGSADSARALRDMLPQLNKFGYPVPGTMGDGLENDPTLGGILPDSTQYMWIEESDGLFQPVGTPTIAESTINVADGTVTDWWAAPVFTDIIGEIGAEPYRDIQSLYLAKDSSSLYIRIDTAGEIPTANLYNWLGYSVFLRQLAGDQYDMPNDSKIQVFYSWVHAQWMAELKKVDSYGNSVLIATLNSTDFQLVGNHLEIKIPLAQIGSLGGRFVGVSSEGWYGSDENYTCLQIQPAATVNGTLSVPGYDGTGPVYVGAFNYASFFNTEPRNRIGSQAIFPDAAGSLPASYSIADLPVGAKVFLSVFWDRDSNGVVTPGDYTDYSLPFTTATGENQQDLALNDDHPAYPAPLFTLTRIYNEKSPAGNWDVLLVASLSGPSPGDVAVTVTGPGGEYRLSPGAWIANRLGLVYSARNPWLPDGDYTFTAIDSLGRTAQTTVHYQSRWDLPSVANLLPSDRGYASTATPTLSWTPPTGGPYTYQVWIADYNFSTNSVFWYVSDLMQATSFTVPAGVLLPNTPYQWFVRLYDSASQPMNFTMSPVNRFYTGVRAASPGYQSVRIGSLPPTGAMTTYQQWVEIKMPDIAPWEISAWRLMRGENQIAGGTVPALFNRADDSFLQAFLPPAATPLATASDYRLEMDVLLPGSSVPTTISRTDIAFEFNAVETPSLDSLTPANNYYFKTTTPSFSWGTVSNPGTWYRLRIYESRGQLPVYTGSWSENTSATVPAGVLKAGGTYLWTVITTPSLATSGYTIAYVNAEGNYTSRALLRFTIQPPLMGDVSGNGEANLEDLVRSLQIVSGQRPAVVPSGDVNADGRAGLPEALYLLQELSGRR